jgi:hypothetical protein
MKKDFYDEVMDYGSHWGGKMEGKLLNDILFSLFQSRLNAVTKFD